MLTLEGLRGLGQDDMPEWMRKFVAEQDPIKAGTPEIGMRTFTAVEMEQFTTWQEGSLPSGFPAPGWTWQRDPGTRSDPTPRFIAIRPGASPAIVPERGLPSYLTPVTATTITPEGMSLGTKLALGGLGLAALLGLGWLIWRK